MQASQEATRIDTTAGQSAEEISAVVASINDRIKGRKDVLAPKIKELRAARARMSDLTDAHEEARAAHRKVQDSHDARLAELEEQVASLQSAVEEVRCGLRVGVPRWAMVELCTLRRDSWKRCGVWNAVGLGYNRL